MGLIVILDDSDDDRFFIKRHISRRYPGRSVLEFTYAADALAFLKHDDSDGVDLVMVDIDLPRMNGFEFLDALGSLPDQLRDRTTVLVMSNSIDPTDSNRATAYPLVSGFVNKPIKDGSLQRYLDS